MERVYSSSVVTPSSSSPSIPLHTPPLLPPTTTLHQRIVVALEIGRAQGRVKLPAKGGVLSLELSGLVAEMIWGEDMRVVESIVQICCHSLKIRNITSSKTWGGLGSLGDGSLILSVSPGSHH